MKDLRIAFVDDELPMHEMMKSILFAGQAKPPVDLFAEHETEEPAAEESPQYQIDFFSESDTARKALGDAYQEKRAYTLLITDIRMPGHDGNWLIHQARQIDPYIRIIVFTSYADATVDELAQSVGSKEFIYLEKTVSPAVIKQAIDSELAAWMALNRNRRMLERLEFKEKVRFRSPEEFSGLAVDVSEGGIGVINVPGEIEVDSPVEFELDAGRIGLQGRVRWLKKERDGFRVGIQFDEEDRELLELAKRSTGDRIKQ